MFLAINSLEGIGKKVRLTRGKSEQFSSEFQLKSSVLGQFGGAEEGCSQSFIAVLVRQELLGG
jgi:hypothetical protein